ncbi:hypothetical protein PLUTE_a0692 [Pseudoalteromonas luteoviolacea DSM 6061]|nr:hypothetical protein [Pseudoalteromonas luteoviolacea DSM 6061]
MRKLDALYAYNTLLFLSYFLLVNLIFAESCPSVAKSHIGNSC